MPPRGGERITKSVLGVVAVRCCFKKKIIGRYHPSFLGQRRCQRSRRVVNPPFLLVISLLDFDFFSIISISILIVAVSFFPLPSFQQTISELAPPPLNTILDHPHNNNITTTIIPPIKRFRSYNKLFSSKPQKSTSSNLKTDPSTL